MTRHISNRVYGCLIGGAIGDALGATVEGWTYKKVREEYGKIDTFRKYENPHSRGEAGSITDDTVMTHYLCLAIVEQNGRVTPDEYADVLLENLNPDRVWVSEEIVIRKLALGINPWEAGRENIPAGTAAMSVAPVGIINATNPRQAYQDGYNIASVNQDKLNRDAAATVAAGIAEALSPDASIESVLEVMLEQSSGQIFRAMDIALELANESDTVDEFVEVFYEELLDWRWPAVEWDIGLYREGRVFSADSIECLPVVVGILSLCGEDANQSIVESASFGRDSDTIAALTGNFVGAVYGAERLRDDWIEECENANGEFFDEVHGDEDVRFETVANWMIEALEGEHRRMKQRAEAIAKVL